MKKLYILLVIFLFLFSCKKKDAPLYELVDGEIIYSDSFLSPAWDEPVKRQKIEAVDRNIGKFIKDDVVDPELRKMIQTIGYFVSIVDKDNLDSIKKYLSPAAYNSLKLRFAPLHIKEKYIIRVAYPDFMLQSPAGDNLEEDGKKRYAESPNNDVQSGMPDSFWIDFKVLFASQSIISTCELKKEGNRLVINDFENKFFADLEKMAGK